MKKIILASLLALTGSVAFAQTTACSAGSATAIGSSTTQFIRVGFTPVCSANSVVRFTDDAVLQRVYGGAASGKGANYYGGSTLGGAIQRVGACAGGSCGGVTGATTSADLGHAEAINYGVSS
jgi:hypothetical protein